MLAVFSEDAPLALIRGEQTRSKSESLSGRLPLRFFILDKRNSVNVKSQRQDTSKIAMVIMIKVIAIRVVTLRMIVIVIPMAVTTMSVKHPTLPWRSTKTRKAITPATLAPARPMKSSAMLKGRAIASFAKQRRRTTKAVRGAPATAKIPPRVMTIRQFE